jgi:hypothetical protein
MFIFSNMILFFFVVDTHYEKQFITPLGYFKFFRPPRCLQETHENGNYSNHIFTQSSVENVFKKVFTFKNRH